jgi:hypothetical protein
VRDALHGHQPGTFWASLRRKAVDSGDPRFAAFAMGIPVGYATALTVNPLVNGIVGGPHRTQWWRHRWVSQYVDAWVWGHYRTRAALRERGRDLVFPLAGTGGRVPLPPYPAWENVAGSNLHERLAVGGITPEAVFTAFGSKTPMPAFLPSGLATMIVDTYRDVVGDPGPRGVVVDAAGVQGAYATTWLTTWLAGSGEVLGATPSDRIDGPDKCGDRPDWAAPDGSIVTGGATEQPPHIGAADPNVPEVASAIVAGILATLEFLCANLVAGVVGVIVAVGQAERGLDPGWPALRCASGWLDVYFANLQIGLRELFTTVGLVPPYAAELAHKEDKFTILGQIDPPSAALATCMSPSALEDGYPHSTWRPSATPGPTSDWTLYPGTEIEAPRQTSYVDGPLLPMHAVDGVTVTADGPGSTPPYSMSQDNPVDRSPSGTPKVLDPAEWEQRMGRAEAGQATGSAFGNAVDVALELIAAPPEALLDWDLDGDRGIGWPAWVRKSPDPFTVERES